MGVAAGPRVRRCPRRRGARSRLDSTFRTAVLDAFEGLEISQGVQLAVDEQNAAGGINGRQLETVIGDNQCDPGVGVNSARHLIDVDQVDVMIGSGCSSVTLAVMPLLQQGEVPPLMSRRRTRRSPKDLVSAGIPGSFGLNLNDALMAKIFAERVIEKEVKSLAIFAVQTIDYGRGAVERSRRTSLTSRSSPKSTSP